MQDMRDTLSLDCCCRWRQQARNLREAAEAPLFAGDKPALLRSAEAADRQADWWMNGAIEHYAPTHPYWRPRL